MPAAAAIRVVQVLLFLTGRKGYVGGLFDYIWKNKNLCLYENEDLSLNKVSGIIVIWGKPVVSLGTPKAKATGYLRLTLRYESIGYQTGLVSPVVHAVNDGCSILSTDYDSFLV